MTASSDESSGSRAERYRVFARLAQARAEKASTPELREAFSRLADGWRQLAEHIESIERERS